MSKLDEARKQAFEDGMKQLSGVYGREFTAPAVRAYFEGCAGWTDARIRRAFKLAIESEKFCPTVATLRAYGASVREVSQAPVVTSGSFQPYTPEQRAELDQWKREFAAGFKAPPWMREP